MRITPYSLLLVSLLVWLGRNEEWSDAPAPRLLVTSQYFHLTSTKKSKAGLRYWYWRHQRASNHQSLGQAVSLFCDLISKKSSLLSLPTQVNPQPTEYPPPGVCILREFGMFSYSWAQALSGSLSLVVIRFRHQMLAIFLYSGQNFYLC